MPDRNTRRIQNPESGMALDYVLNGQYCSQEYCSIEELTSLRSEWVIFYFIFKMYHESAEIYMTTRRVSLLLHFKCSENTKLILPLLPRTKASP